MKSIAKKFAVLLGVPALVVQGVAMCLLMERAQAQGGGGASAGPAVNRGLVVLDPAHGGADAGAKLGDGLLEKDVTLALAARLRAALTTEGFGVVSTRQADGLDVLTTDQRAETANRVHAAACLMIHATGAGVGVHLYVSALEGKDAADVDGDERPGFVATPWDTAQAEWVGQSVHLQNDLGAALGAANLPVVMERARVRPLDNLMCPAVALELAPLVAGGGDKTPVNDAEYQRRVVETLVRALQAWRGHAEVPHPRPAEMADEMKESPVVVGAGSAAAQAMAAADASGVAAVKAHGVGAGAGSGGALGKGGPQ